MYTFLEINKVLRETEDLIFTLTLKEIELIIKILPTGLWV
jgi:hypothetical protein